MRSQHQRVGLKTFKILLESSATERPVELTSGLCREAETDDWPKEPLWPFFIPEDVECRKKTAFEAV
jgi:hypothetical protein